MKLLQPFLRGYRLRLERKGYTMRRNARFGMIPFSPRRQYDPILMNLYNQALEMGLPQSEAGRILSIGQRFHTSNAYGNPASRHTAAAGNAPYGPSLPSYGPSSYRPQPSNIEYPQFAPPPASDQYGQYASAEPTYSAIPHMNEGTTYYSNPNQPSQATVQYETGAPLEPIYGTGYSYNYNYNYEDETYTPLNPIPESSGNEHRYSHEIYGPYTYAGEPYIPEMYAGQFAHGHGHGHH